ncbi:BTE_collapsed_G0019980.mRNA.1.CDS.1 [Saccharomyces cerevisiae]|nr:BTE_collapsed_G0019980.mRNA.1.CDS.1 [Saccharomyces cerevisiae]
MQKCAGHAPLVTAASRVSQDTVDALLQAILKAFHKLASIDSHNNDPVEIAFKLINSFKYLPISGSSVKDFESELRELDVFSPLLQSAVTAANNSNIIWDLIAVLFAYISIHKQFHPLILHNLNIWKDFMADNDEETATTTDGDSMNFGVLSLLSIVQNFEEITPNLFEFLKLGLRSTLLKIWVPQWQRYDPSATNLINGDEKISSWITKDYQVDFFIITSLASTSSLEVLPSHYFVYKISKRISHFPNLIDPKLYRSAISTIMENGISDNGGGENSSDKIDPTDLSFHFQVLMEVIDHPELNYLQENRLILLLDIALNYLILVPTHCLHSNFGELGSTQSLASTLNIIQFLLSKFLINMGSISQLINQSNRKCITTNNINNNNINNNGVINGSTNATSTTTTTTTTNNNNNNNNSSISNNNRKIDWTQSYQTRYQIPYWFEDSILPPIPPISKSLFTFDKNLDHESDSIMIVNDVLRCLNLTILLISKLLRDYDDLKINPLIQSSDDHSNEDNHVIIEQYMQLYLVPLFTSLLLAQQLKDRGQERDEGHKEKEENINLIGSSSVKKLFSQLIFFSSLKLCENLVIKEKNLALYHLIKFATKISLDDLILQKISINLLNHLFFHQIRDGSDDDNLIKKLCLKNQLSFQALKDYITLWNDGSEVYNAFYKELFYEEQPKIKPIKLTTSDLLKLFPEDVQFVISTPPNTITSASTSDNCTSSQSAAQKNIENFTTLSKYDAYSSTSFIPSTSKNTNTNVNKQQQQQPQNSTPCSSNRFLFNKSSLISQERNGSNNNSGTQGPGSMNESYSLDNSFNTTNTNMTRQPTTLTRATDAMTTAPTTPTPYKNTSGSSSNNLWIESPMTNFKGSTISKSTNKSKMVNTGKNYILGGHNKVKNNSRAQSIHIDDFENENN